MPVILWFIVFYLLFKFITRFVLPLISATQVVRSKMDDMRSQMNANEYEQTQQSANTFQANNNSSKNHSEPVGDYIDFEEIK